MSACINSRLENLFSRDKACQEPLEDHISKNTLRYIRIARAGKGCCQHSESDIAFELNQFITIKKMQEYKKNNNKKQKLKSVGKENKRKEVETSLGKQVDRLNTKQPIEGHDDIFIVYNYPSNEKMYGCSYLAFSFQG